MSLTPNSSSILFPAKNEGAHQDKTFGKFRGIRNSGRNLFPSDVWKLCPDAVNGRSSDVMLYRKLSKEVFLPWQKLQ